MTVLTLEIVGGQAGTVDAERRKVFRGRGGTIGRVPENDWVLPHPFVSSRHALVRFADGQYLLEDMSRNGVFINSVENRLERGQPYVLQPGDRIIIDPYEIRVAVASESAEGASFDLTAGAAPFEAAAGAAPLTPAPFAPPSSQPSAVGSDADSYPFGLLGPPPGPPAPSPPSLSQGSAEREYFHPPQPIPPPPGRESTAGGPGEPSIIPSDYDPLRSGDSFIVPAPSPRVPAPPRPAPMPPPPREVPPAAPRTHAEVGPRSDARRADPAPPSGAPVPPPVPEPAGVRPRPGGGGDLTDVLAGAGLPGVPVSPELARQFGEILRIVVSGLIEVLHARQQLKEEFRMGMTTFKPADNNPLKFSANVEDALHNLLVKRNAAYLGPVEAFESAFDDVRDHQMAMLEGVRIAFQATLAEFDPERLEERFERQARGSIVPMAAKMRYWDLYCERFRDIVRDPDTSFRELFGEEFARAYEQQLARLKAQRGSAR